MKRICSFILVICLTLSLLGCSSSKIIIDKKQAPKVEPGIAGYVMKVANRGMLVVSQGVQDFSSTGGVKEFYNAIWFSNAPKEIKMGDQVKVWFDEVLDSYPGQSKAKHIEVIASEKPDGANLNSSEALNKALKTDKVNADEVIVVKSIAYDKQADQWNIVLKQTWGDKTYNIQVEDK
jgi:ketosteroid isomerase-like protein